MFPHWRGSVAVLVLAGILGVIARAKAGSLTTASAEAAFTAENQAAMSKMMAGMEVKPSGDVDQDFAATMIPHHQGAIDMAQAELRYGQNEQLRRIAQGIIVDQQQEIAAMRLALGHPPPPSVAAPDQPSDLWVPAARPASTPAMSATKGAPR